MREPKTGPKGDWLRLCSRRWASAIKRGRYEDALMVAVWAYMLARELKDMPSQSVTRTYMTVALRQLGEREDRTLRAENKRLVRCSFCGRDQHAVKLVVGAAGNICEDCAASAHSFFRRDDKTQGRKRRLSLNPSKRRTGPARSK